jgi:drug/metabolite transporter (DMT)-like permease
VPTSRTWQIQFLILSATWGSSFLFIKVIGRHWPAVWVAFGRVALGALTLLLIMRWRGDRLRLDHRTWIHLAVAAVFFNAAPFTLFAEGEKHVSSIVAGLWNATTPLWVLTISLIAFPEQHPTRDNLAGLLVGFIGVAILLGPWRGIAGGQLTGHLLCAGAALCYGIGFPYTRRYLADRPESGLVLATGQLVCATAWLAIALPFAGRPSSRIGLDGAGSILVLGVLGTGIAYILNYAVVRAAGAAIASTVTYVIPVFSTALGVLVLGETLHWNQPAGTLVLFAGIAISQGRLRLPSRARAPSAA